MSDQGQPTDPSPDLIALAERGVRMFEAYQATGQEGLAAESIACFVAAYGAAPDDDPRRGVLLTCISASTRVLFERTGQLELLKACLETSREAMQHAPRGHPEHASALSGLALALWASYKHDGSVSTLTEAVEAGRSALQASAADDPARGERLGNTAMCLLDLFEHTGNVDLLAEAEQLSRSAVVATPADHPDYPQRLMALGNTLMACFHHDGREETLQEAVEKYRTGLGACPEGHSSRAAQLNNLANALRNLFTQSGRIEALREAIELGRAAVAATPADHSDRARWQSNLVLGLRIEFEQTGDLEALREAVDTGRAAVAATPTQHPERGGRLSVLANALYRWAEYTGEVATIEEALDTARAAVAAVPAGHSERASMLSDVGIAARLLYSHTGRVEVLIEAAEFGRSAVEASNTSSPSRPSYLNNLGIALRTLYERTGDDTALAGAVEAGRASVEATPPNHAQRIAHVTNLVFALQRMYSLTGHADLILEAVRSARETVAATSEEFSERAAVMQSLGNVLREAYERSGSQEILGEAARMLRAALEATPAGHSGRPGILNDLATTLQLLDDYTAEHDGLAAAYYFFREAVSTISPDHADRFKIAGNMAAVAVKISSRDRSPEIGREAVALLRAVAQALAENHPERASRLCGLGFALKNLAALDESNAAGLLNEARASFRAAANNDAASVRVRITAGREQTELDLAAGDAPKAALESIERVVELIEQVAPGSLGRTDRAYQLAQLEQLPAQAAAAALSAGRPDRAVELLERTRGVLAAETLGLRSPEHSELRATNPDLAQQLDRARVALAELDQGPVERRVAAHATFNDVLARIRAVPGFESFLRPGLADMPASANGGAVVWVNCHATRCDALILTGEGVDHVHHVPLPDLKYDEVIENNKRLRQACQSARTSRDLLPSGTRTDTDQTISQLVAWLWDAVTDPVLSALGYAATPNDDAGANAAWPRIWWCPVGVAAGLPLHAAGHHDDPVNRPEGRRAVLDRVMSSYTPTLLALRPKATREGAPPAAALVISVPDTPGMRLPGAEREARALQRLLPNASVLASPKRAEVLNALPKHLIAHFACHCDTNLAHPDRSHLMLSDHDVAPLTVNDVIRLEVDADLAYLSACSTSVTAQQLADEALHVTGAFHLAGYRHVIGTLWPVIDDTAADLAADFYERLIQGSDKPQVQTGRAAEALHQAVRALRDRRPAEPTLWAPYTHTGA